jgi:hypothetical protein
MTVYIIQEPRRVRDLSSATDYGEVKYLLDTVDNPSSLPGPCLRKITVGLKDFMPGTDYIGYAGGDPAALLLVGGALADLGVDSYQYLRWDRIRNANGDRPGGGVYVPVRFPIRP